MKKTKKQIFISSLFFLSIFFIQVSLVSAATEWSFSGTSATTQDYRTYKACLSYKESRQFAGSDVVECSASGIATLTTQIAGSGFRCCKNRLLDSKFMYFLKANATIS